jgi:hypothetical protein
MGRQLFHNPIVSESLDCNRLAENACKARDAQPSSPWAGLRLPSRARQGTVEQESAFACVARERCGVLELRLCFGEAAELEKKVAPNAGQEVVGLEGRLRGECVDELETRRWTEPHRDRDCAIQLHDG